jgi:hypothetical protein
MAGTQGTKVAYDDQGNRYVQHPALTAGQQWAKIGAEAFRGAGAGMAAGRGAGNGGRALFAGQQVEQNTEDQQRQQQETEADKGYQVARQQRMDKANQQIQQMTLTKMGLENARLQTETNENIQKFADYQTDRLKAEGAFMIPGDYNSMNIQDVQKAYPDFFQDHFNYSNIHPIVASSDGKISHVNFWVVPKDRATQPVSEDDAKKGLPVWVPSTDANNPIGHVDWKPIESGSISQGTYDTALDKASQAQIANQKQISDSKKEATETQPKTYAEALAAASAATDPKEKARLTGLANQMLSGEERLRVAGRNITTVQQGNSGLVNDTPARNEAYLQSLPKDYQNQVKAMANGDTALPSASTRNKEGVALRNMAFNYDPSLTDARYAAKQNFKNKGESDNVKTLSTMLEHLENMQNASKVVGLSPRLNMGSNLQSADDAAYNKHLSFFTHEAGKLIKGGMLTQGEYEELKKGMDSVRESVRDASINAAIQDVGGRVRATYQKYKTAVGTELPTNEFFDQQSQQRLARYGLAEAPAAAPSAQPGANGLIARPQGMPAAKPGTVTVQIPGTAPHDIPQSALQQFTADHKDAKVYQ